MTSSKSLPPTTPLEDIVMVAWACPSGPGDAGEIIVRKYDDLAGTWKTLPDFYQDLKDTEAIEQDRSDA